MSTPLTTATPATVANLSETHKEIAAAKKAHPAGKALAKAPAKKAPAKKAETKSEPRKYVAKARSGQEAIRTCPFKATHAVDVKKPDGKKASYAAGVIVRFFASKDAAEKFAEAVNDGTLARSNDWYQGAVDAIVVTAKEA